MAVIETNNYRPDIIPGNYEHSNEELAEFGRDVRVLLFRLGFLKQEAIDAPTVNGQSDVSITEEFKPIKAASAYGWVVKITASGSNPDFTDEWRAFHFTHRNDQGQEIYEQDLQALKDLKRNIDGFAEEILRPKWFSEAVGVDLGLNLWISRTEAVFAVVYSK